MRRVAIGLLGACLAGPAPAQDLNQIGRMLGDQLLPRQDGAVDRDAYERGRRDAEREAVQRRDERDVRRDLDRRDVDRRDVDRRNLDRRELDRRDVDRRRDEQRALAEREQERRRLDAGGRRDRNDFDRGRDAERDAYDRRRRAEDQ